MSNHWSSPWRTRRAERLLRDDFRQHHVVVRLGEAQALAVEAGGVGGEDVAAARFVGLHGLVVGGEGDGFQLHLVAAKIIREVEFGGGALADANRRFAQFERRLDLELLAHHEALAVEIIDTGEVEAERGVARAGPGGVAREHVDLARLQGGEAVLGGERHELDLLRIVENRRGDGAAEVDVETGPVALGVGQAEAGKPGVAAAVERAARLDRGERLRLGGRRGKAEHRRTNKHDENAFHGTAPVFRRCGDIFVRTSRRGR